MIFCFDLQGKTRASDRMVAVERLGQRLACRLPESREKLVNRGYKTIPFNTIN